MPYESDLFIEMIDPAKKREIEEFLRAAAPDHAASIIESIGQKEKGGFLVRGVDDQIIGCATYRLEHRKADKKNMMVLEDFYIAADRAGQSFSHAQAEGAVYEGPAAAGAFLARHLHHFRQQVGYDGLSLRHVRTDDREALNAYGLYALTGQTIKITYNDLEAFLAFKPGETSPLGDDSAAKPGNPQPSTANLLNIRPIDYDDTDSILKLVRDTKPQDIDLVGQANQSGFIIETASGVPVGFALCEKLRSVLMLDYFCISPDFENQVFSSAIVKNHATLQGPKAPGAFLADYLKSLLRENETIDASRMIDMPEAAQYFGIPQLRRDEASETPPVPHFTKLERARRKLNHDLPAPKSSPVESDEWHIVRAKRVEDPDTHKMRDELVPADEVDCTNSPEECFFVRNHVPNPRTAYRYTANVLNIPDTPPPEISRILEEGEIAGQGDVPLPISWADIILKNSHLAQLQRDYNSTRQ